MKPKLWSAPSACLVLLLACPASTPGASRSSSNTRRSSRPIPSTTMPRAWSSSPDGSLLAAWYAGSGERTADDVVIEGAWLGKGKKAWGPKFLLADTPGYPDCNPALFAAPDGLALALLADDPRPSLGRGLAQVRPLRAAHGRARAVEMAGVRSPARHPQRLRRRGRAGDRGP